MTVAANLSVSLDSYFAGPDANSMRMLGSGGEVLHSWFAHEVADREELTADQVLRPEMERAGAMVMGRDSYEIAESAWGQHPPFEGRSSYSPTAHMKMTAARARRSPLSRTASMRRRSGLVRPQATRM